MVPWNRKVLRCISSGIWTPASFHRKLHRVTNRLPRPLHLEDRSHGKKVPQRGAPTQRGAFVYTTQRPHKLCCHQMLWRGYCCAKSIQPTEQEGQRRRPTGNLVLSAQNGESRVGTPSHNVYTCAKRSVWKGRVPRINSSYSCPNGVTRNSC